MIRMMKHLLWISALLFSQMISAQPDSLFYEYVKPKVEKPKWVQKNKAKVDISEVTFVNWNSGGSNSISALFGVASSMDYKYKNLYWKNKGEIRYGVNKQQSQTLRKTEDIIELTSNFGFRKDTITNWFFNGRFNFKTQFTNGYNYPDVSKSISQFMAPGYLFLGAGLEYGKNMDRLSIYFSPMTLKATFVMDQALANAGAFGVRPAVIDSNGNVLVRGEQVRNEVGILIVNSYEMKLFENIAFKSEVSLYTDYINSLGNVDVDWLINFDFKVNQFVRASLGSHLKYDDDIKIQEETEIEGIYIDRGAKVQWKQLLGIGVVIDF